MTAAAGAGAVGSAAVGPAALRRDSVRRRREELATQRRRLSAGPRADVATVLELARSACREELSADLTRMREQAERRIAHARPAELAGVPAALSVELTGIGDRLDRSVGTHTAPGLRRLAAWLLPGAEPLPLPSSPPAPHLTATPPATPPPTPASRTPSPSPASGRTGRLLAATAGPGPESGGARAALSDARLFGALVGIPVLAVHGIGPSTALLLAGSMLLLGCLVRARAVADDRARHRAHLLRVVDAAATAGERELHRGLVATEAAVVAALERAVPARRGRVDAELAVLDR